MMIKGILVLFCVLGAAAAVTRVLFRKYLRRWRADQMRQGRKLFQLRREWLEAEFLAKAEASGKPRGLRWADCDFESKVSFARDRTNGHLRALVGATIAFEAIPGGDMEDVEAVSNLRSATAVFYFDGNRWDTDGRAIFNLSPSETIEHFHHELEAV